jgi:type 2 lantibiotic biosynthesis protein LanM
MPKLTPPPEDPGDPLPFADLLAPGAADAGRELRGLLASLGAGSADLTATAWQDLERSLVRRLSALTAHLLEADFDVHRKGRPDAFAVRLAELRARPETDRYREFVAGELAGGLGGWSRRWPVAAGLAETLTALWIRNGAEMLQRLRQDRPAIARELFSGGDPGPVERISAPLSDPHGGGRSVHALTFQGGHRIIYKPRSLGLESDFARLLTWCNEHGLSLPLRGARALDRGSHGWMELVAPEPCRDEVAVRRFHARMGLLLGLLHAFGSRDCHCENLVACGEVPVLIDLEAWLPVRLRKWLPGEGTGAAWYEAAGRIERSVLSTGLLPKWQEGRRRGELRNIGALGGGHPGAQTALVWLNAGSDQMTHAWRPVETATQPNVPILDGRPVEPWGYREEVVAGFEEMYALLLHHRRELLAPQGPLPGIARHKTRLVFRSTASYRRLLERSLQPESCRDPAVRSSRLNALAEVYLAGEGPSPAWPLMAAERQALEQCDVPLFRVPVESLRIEGPDGEPLVDGALEMSSLAAAADGLARLGDEDRRLQIGFIRAALSAGPVSPRGGSPEGRSGPGPCRDQLLETAAAIAARLHDSAVMGADGSAAWIGPRSLTQGDRYELAVLGADLYGGTAGVALFLAAFGAAAGDGRSRDLALQAIAPLCREQSRERLKAGIGGLTGIASIVYALVWIGELLHEKNLLQEAFGWAVRLTRERIRQDEDLDIVSGASGVILALLALDRAAPGADLDGITPLGIALECAAHLLARRTAKGWPFRGKAPLAGFSHGAAGIRYALLRLYARTGREDLKQAALADRSRETGESARDPRLPQEASQATWCHGAPGIALSRLGALDVLDGPEVRREIQTGLEATRSQPLSEIDHLCCGNLGRAEVLLHASHVLGEERWCAEAWHIASRVLFRPGRRHFGCAPFGDPMLTDPSLFRGESGIGLFLLRLAGAGNLPCILLLDPPP